MTMNNAKDLPLEQMNERELLVELVNSQKKTERAQLAVFFAMLGILVALAVALVIVVPQAVDIMKGAKETTVKMNQFIDDAQSSLKQVDEMVGNVNQMVVDNTESVNVAIGNFNNIDFDHLNKAIEDLSNVVEPLAKFFNVFKKQ